MPKLGKFLTSGLLIGLLVGGNTFAATSSAAISTNETSAYGNSISLNLGTNTKLYGSNDSSSVNSVHVQKIRTVAGPDNIRDQFTIGPGDSSSSYTVTGKTGSYHVGLNPKGAMKKGVSGFGYLTDRY